LFYTSIEAGKAGGRRGELRLRASKDNQVAEEGDFVQMAYNLAHILGGGSEDNYESMQIKKRSLSREKHPLVRRLVTKESKLDSVFKYFAMRPSDFGDKRGAVEKGLEESERCSEKVEDNSEANSKSRG
jgi:hypothetical protein